MLISVAAKLENTAKDMIVYTSLGSAVNLMVEFLMNPVSNYDIYWSLGASAIRDNVRNTVIKKHVKTTYFILNVTNQQLGNYRVPVFNWALPSEQNEVIFNVKLKLRGKLSRAITFLGEFQI